MEGSFGVVVVVVVVGVDTFNLKLAQIKYNGDPRNIGRLSNINFELVNRKFSGLG